jgi:hypothetical protein
MGIDKFFFIFSALTGVLIAKIVVEQDVLIAPWKLTSRGGSHNFDARGAENQPYQVNAAFLRLLCQRPGNILANNYEATIGPDYFKCPLLSFFNHGRFR